MTLRRRHVYEQPDLTGRKPATVVMSNGLGVDSMTLLHQWCTDPSTRDFPLNELLIITAIVGNEYESTITAANIGNLGYQNMRSTRGPVEASPTTAAVSRPRAEASANQWFELVEGWARS